MDERKQRRFYGHIALTTCHCLPAISCIAAGGHTDDEDIKDEGEGQGHVPGIMTGSEGEVSHWAVYRGEGWGMGPRCTYTKQNRTGADNPARSGRLGGRGGQ